MFETYTWILYYFPGPECQICAFSGGINPLLKMFETYMHPGPECRISSQTFANCKFLVHSGGINALHQVRELVYTNPSFT